jgi:20S proteasome subunit alpha 1
MSRGGSMGFDRHITIFSPEGRLFQVEYASKATKLSCSTCIAVKNIDTVCAVILNKKKGGKHQSQSNFKIFSLSEFMGCIYNGLNGDIQMKIQETIIESTDFFEKFNYKIPMDYLIKRISDRNQFFTQYAYMRPLGVKMLIMGIDEEMGPQLFKNEPSGFFSSYQICAIGEKENFLSSYLIKRIETKLKNLTSYIKTVSYILSIFKNFLEFDIKTEDIEIVISVKKKSIFRLLDPLEIETILNYSD